MRVVYEYGARGAMPPLTLTWHQGESRPKIWTDGGIPQWPDAQLFIGDKGMILSSGDKHVLLPEKEFADFVPPPETIPNSPGHYAEWIEACKGGKPSLANFDYAGWTTEANHLGNVAYRVGKKLAVGRRRDEGHQRAGGRAVHQPRVSKGVGPLAVVVEGRGAEVRGLPTDWSDNRGYDRG